jgi:hypothetical protein
MSQDPNEPPPQEDPTHDVPVYPEHDPPPATEQPIKAGDPSERKRLQEAPGEVPQEEEEDVDEDDLDPQVPHSPPDSKKSKIVFDESEPVG